MSDRELLELAAKVGGFIPGCPELLGNDGWNPLTDDGDALRLAVRIVQMTSFFRFMKGFIAAFRTEEYFSANDGCKPTRRAIVRAAAEIGKAMP